MSFIYCSPPEYNLEEIFAFKNVEAIVSQSDITNFQDLWSKSNAVAYFPDNPVSAIMDFISVLDKKKEDWTKFAEARYVFHNTFVALSRTSSEVFGRDWKRSGVLHPSHPASLWTAAIKVLGCSFNLKVQIKLTSKGILKSYSRDLQVGGNKLIFDDVCKSIKIKAGRFLKGKVTRQLFAKK